MIVKTFCSSKLIWLFAVLRVGVGVGADLLNSPVSVCQSGPFEEYRAGECLKRRIIDTVNGSRCTFPKHAIPFSFPVQLPSSLFDLHSLCASSAPRWAVSVSVSSMPLSAPTAADLLSPKSSELYDIVLVHDRLLLPLVLPLLLVLVLVLLLLHLFQCAQIESEFCCSAAPQTAVPPLPLPLSLPRGSNNCKQLNNAAKQTKINNNFNFSLSLLLLLLYSLRELFFMARVYLGLFVRCQCVCACVCVVKICFFFLYLKIGSIFVVCAFLARLQQVSGVWVRAWAWARALRPSLSDAAGLALR